MAHFPTNNSGGENPRASVSSEIPNIVLEMLQNVKNSPDALLVWKEPHHYLLPPVQLCADTSLGGAGPDGAPSCRSDKRFSTRPHLFPDCRQLFWCLTVREGAASQREGVPRSPERGSCTGLDGRQNGSQEVPWAHQQWELCGLLQGKRLNQGGGRETEEARPCLC